MKPRFDMDHSSHTLCLHICHDIQFLSLMVPFIALLDAGQWKLHPKIKTNDVRIYSSNTLSDNCKESSRSDPYTDCGVERGYAASLKHCAMLSCSLSYLQVNCNFSVIFRRVLSKSSENAARVRIICNTSDVSKWVSGWVGALWVLSACNLCIVHYSVKFPAPLHQQSDLLDSRQPYRQTELLFYREKNNYRVNSNHSQLWTNYGE